MAQRYPGKMFPQVKPLMCLPSLDFQKTVFLLSLVWLISVYCGVHWLLVPGCYAVWILTSVPHAYFHLIADRIFKREAITDWAGPIPNLLIVLVCYFASVSLAGGIKTIATEFRATITHEPFVFLLTLLYAGNLWGVLQHFFLPWPANDPDVGLITKLFIRRLRRS